MADTSVLKDYAKEYANMINLGASDEMAKKVAYYTTKSGGYATFPSGTGEPDSDNNTKGGGTTGGGGSYPGYPQLPKPKVLSWDEAIKRARARLTPGIEANTKAIVKQLQNNALQRGFYGQLPTEEFERATRTDLASQGEASIAQLADDMVGQSEEAARAQEALGLQQQQMEYNQRMAGLSMKNSQEQAEWDKWYKMYVAVKDSDNPEDQSLAAELRGKLYM